MIFAERKNTNQRKFFSIIVKKTATLYDNDNTCNFEGYFIVKYKINRVTPELRMSWVFPANTGVQTNFYSYNIMVLHTCKSLVNISNILVTLL